jgi:hypothetical protein
MLAARACGICSDETTLESVVTVPKPVATLLTPRRLERVPADRPSAQLRLGRADEKLDASRKIAAIDTEIAYVTAYDAVTNSPSTGEYQRIRRRRNKSEYDDITIGTADLTADLAHADAVIQAVRGRALSRPGTPARWTSRPTGLDGDVSNLSGGSPSRCAQQKSCPRSAGQDHRSIQV